MGEDNLKQGKTQSCGCLHNELLAKRNERHSLSKTRIYYIFNGMKDRCYNNKNKSYKDYGGRGITICDEWLNDFVVFYKWATENGYKEGLSIERIDVNKGYSPENCAWIPKEMQAKNTRKNVFYEYKGEKKILGDWAKQYNLPFTCVRRRLNRGWTLERALNTPNMRNQI